MEQRAEELTAWVAGKYAGRHIPFSGEPYFVHCLAVAEAAAPYVNWGYEAGLCHDLLEDHVATVEELRMALSEAGYCLPETEQIIAMIIELSDVFTTEHFPDFSDKELRRLENKRLLTISSQSQTIKYADLIDNAAWVRRYEPYKWPRYARRKLKLLAALDKGSQELRRQALEVLSCN